MCGCVGVVKPVKISLEFVNDTNSPVIIYYYNTRVVHHVAIEVWILLWKLANAPLAFNAGIQMTRIFPDKYYTIHGIIMPACHLRCEPSGRKSANQVLDPHLNG
jgi:hypothetical protein